MNTSVEADSGSPRCEAFLGLGIWQNPLRKPKGKNCICFTMARPEGHILFFKFWVKQVC